MASQHQGSTLWPQSLILLDGDGNVWFGATDVVTADYHYRSGAVDADVAWVVADAVTGQVTPGAPSTGEAGCVRVIIWRTTPEGDRQSYGEELLWAILPSSVAGTAAAGTGLLRTVTVPMVLEIGGRVATAVLDSPVALGTDADVRVRSVLGDFPALGSVYPGAGVVTLSADRRTITATLPDWATWQADDWCEVSYKTR